MKIGILFLSWVLVFCASGSLAEAYDGGILSSGLNHTCTIDDEGVKCWGLNSEGQADVPPLTNPTLVSAGGHHVCAIHDKGVKCWGSDSDGQTEVPPLKNPTSISVGDWHTCAIDDEGVKCWGSNRYGRINVPPLKNPVSLSAGYDHTCAVDDEGVKCWGSNGNGQTNVPFLKNPTSVSAGDSHTCAIDDEGVKCWGNNSNGQANVPLLKNPTSVSAGDSHTCAIDDEGVKCWGLNSKGQTNVPPLTKPISVSSGSGHTCAMDSEGVKCWGYDGSGQTKVPFLIFFVLNKLEVFIDRLGHWSTLVRTSFFNSLKPFVNENLKLIGTSPIPDQLLNGQYILMGLLKTSIETGDSTYYIERIIPGYRSRMKVINEQTGIHGLNQVKDFSLTRLTALKVMQVSLSIMTEFLTAQDKADIQDIIGFIGLAMTDVSNRQAITNALVAIETNEGIFNKLTQSSKTQFLVLTLQTAQQWLKAKIQ